MPEKTIKDLTPKEFAELFDKSVSANQIELLGVSVTSQKSSLKEIEEVVNRLVEKHKELLKHEVKLKLGYID